MSRVLIDSSCLVAAICSWHEDHEATRREFEKRRRTGEPLIMAAPALVETYSVLTRLPLPHRLTSPVAFQLIEQNWGEHETVALTADQYWKTLRSAQAEGIGGGLVYDALIAACARRAKAEILLTWNIEHFARFADSSLRVSAPGSSP